MICVASMAGHFASLSPELERHLAVAPLDQLLQHDELDIESSNPNQAYTISKRGNQLRVQGLAHAWGSKGARLNSISPGVISTALLRGELETPRGASPLAMIKHSAARRIGTPDDIANVAVFLAGLESSFIIGNDILVDGGAVSARRWN
jgi:NAD(P)-dependent dehydrogenase (short-subunit alcohol dehydrogenase family)